MRKTPPPSLEQELDAALHQVLDENDALKAELARVQGRLDALMTAFDKNGSLGILQLIAHDKNLPVEIRIRAAGLAVPYERPKFGSVDGLAIQVDFKERVRSARLKSLELQKAEWAQAEQPKLDLDAPTPSTILGGPGGHEAEGETLGPDPAA
jgi:hypothetical protein